MFWSGKKAVTLGLADRTGDLRAVLQEKFGEKVRLKLFTTERGFFLRRGAGIAGMMGGAFAESLVSELEARALRDRYRL